MFQTWQSTLTNFSKRFFMKKNSEWNVCSENLEKHATYRLRNVNKTTFKNSNGEFKQHEQLTQKITFSATYTIFMNQIFSENAIFTVFSRFLGSFRRFALKNFLPPKNTWKKLRKKKFQKHSYQDSNQRYHYSEPAAITITPRRRCLLQTGEIKIFKTHPKNIKPIFS